MAHYAFLDENNIVTEVITGIDETETIEGLDTETWYGNFRGQKCVRTSYNNNIRGICAQIGYIYDPEKDIFIMPEPDVSNYQLSWYGVYQSDKPSIMLDSAPRSGIRWFSYLVNKSFPDSFQRWGFKYPHNSKTFLEAQEKFDLIGTVIRNPLDSLASSIVFYELEEHAVMGCIEDCIKILEETVEQKNNISIFTFEDVTNNPQQVLNFIGATINKTPISVNILEIKNQLGIEYSGKGYVVPTDNQEELNNAKTLLSDAKYSTVLSRANSLYNELLASKVLINE